MCYIFPSSFSTFLAVFYLFLLPSFLLYSLFFFSHAYLTLTPLLSPPFSHYFLLFPQSLLSSPLFSRFLHLSPLLSLLAPSSLSPGVVFVSLTPDFNWKDSRKNVAVLHFSYSCKCVCVCNLTVFFHLLNTTHLPTIAYTRIAYLPSLYFYTHHSPTTLPTLIQ